MARTPSEDSEKLRQLDVGESLRVRVNPGELPDKGLQRWRKRVSLLRKEGLSYRSRVDGDAICIQRTLEGLNRQTADLYLMKAGTYLLLKSEPTPADVKKARDLESYAALAQRRARLNGRSATLLGSWLVIIDQAGRLLIVCTEDISGATAEIGDAFVPTHATVILPWAEEWP